MTKKQWIAGIFRKACSLHAAALLPVLLAGCAIGPDYVRPGIDTPAVFKEAGDWKSASPQMPALDDWWKAFGDPVLDALQARDEISNQNLRAGAAR